MAALLVGAALVSACGGSDEGAGGSEDSPVTTEPATAEPAVRESGGTEAPDSAAKNGSRTEGKNETKGKKKGSSGGSTDKGASEPSEVDSKKNDVPPEKGTPAAAFEKFCDENPEACS